MSAEIEHTTLTAELAADYLRVATSYTVVNPADIRSFLAEHPALVPVLLDLYPLLQNEFPKAPLSLHVLRLAEVNQAMGHLFIQVSAPPPVLDAVDRLHRGVSSWLSAIDPAVIQWLLIDVTSSLEPEGATDLAERYRQRFSQGYRLHFDVAQRFLAATPDSDERALAGAELSAALAREQGVALPGRGGDPREVLARLRKEHRSRDHVSDAD